MANDRNTAAFVQALRSAPGLPAGLPGKTHPTWLEQQTAQRIYNSMGGMK